MDPLDRFTGHLKNVLTRALVLVVEMGGETITPAHLLWAIGTERESLGSDILLKAGIELDELRVLAGAPKDPSQLPGSNAAHATPLLSDDAKRAIEKAMLAASLHEHKYVGTEHVLYGLLRINTPPIATFFTTHNTKLQAIDARLASVFQSLKNSEKGKEKTAEQQACDDCGQVHDKDEHDKSALDFFGVELTAKEKIKTLDDLSGREGEIERLASILSRRTKNNPLLLGEAGVGKTAIVEGLAKMIANKTAPTALHGKRIFQIDMASLVAGAMYRGDFEARLTDILEDIKDLGGNAIVFIDELHTVIGAGAGGGALDASNILKPALARGELRLIGATTPAEYKKIIEPDPAFSRRFAPVSVHEMSIAQTRELLTAAAKNYGEHHGVTYTESALDSIVALADRYMHNRHFPDKAIDLLDEVGAMVAKSRKTDTSLSQKAEKEKDLEKARLAKKEAIEQERFADATTLKETEERLVAQLNAFKKAEREVLKIDVKEVTQAASSMLGLPLHTLSENEREELTTLAPRIKERIIGQDDAIERVTQALKRSRLGLQRQDRPLASFMFAGPSGVGKTELAKLLAELGFGNKKNLLKLDMSEYAEGFAVSKLIGSPAGYVGFREGAKLTDHLKNKPHGIIVFDEIEKAHKDVQGLLLQILEDGQLTDAAGSVVNARNAVIILTTNIGRELFSGKSLGLESAQAPTEGALRGSLEESFRPELLNRLDQIIAFNELTKNDLLKIAQKELREIKDRLKTQDINIVVDKTIAALIVTNCKVHLGARDIRRVILECIEYPLTDLVLSKKPVKPVQITTDKAGKLKIKAN
ncbi:ATP-dependent Clp protease ATP-binding subunit [Patescibacteria group bacterium]|nr:ATP-dependent Clp protease ATP-binding subunit [Patescibacteria group bacterium]